MNVLILEGHGYIEKKLANKLIGEGNNVHVLGKICDRDLNVHDIKIGDNRFEELMEKEKFDIIIDVSKISSDKKAFDISVKEIENLFELSKKYSVKKMILLSTTDVYIEGKEINEKSRIIPKTAYGISMLAYEEYYNIYKNIYEADLGILRISNIYGSNLKNSDEYIRTIIEKFLKNENLNEELLRSCKDYICVNDVVNGVYKSVFKEGSFIYNLSYGRSYTGNDILEILKLIIFKEKYSRIEKEYGESISNKLAKKELGWSPTMNFEEGIYLFINDLKNKEAGNKQNRNFIIFLIIDLLIFLVIYFGSSIINNEYEIHILNLIMFSLVLVASILGLKEGIVTGVLSSVILVSNAVAEFNINGKSNTICLDGVIVNVSIYIITSLLIGSIIDKNKREFKRLEKKYNNLYDKLNFVYRLYKDE
ncbi:NAD-dependent epimerase/dehydratase family protein [Clostridium sp. B9]|uniref:NAD-dependent epimerase/dehydratase family protein n=1 Tax=Clostridium sp. B9 TaxID=3423224 RepID=UPI003D2EE6D3